MKTSFKPAILFIFLFAFSMAANAQHTHDTGFKMPPLNPKSELTGISGNREAAWTQPK